MPNRAKGLKREQEKSLTLVKLGNVLVTGGAGFIGSNLVKELVGDN